MDRGPEPQQVPSFDADVLVPTPHPPCQAISVLGGSRCTALCIANLDPSFSRRRGLSRGRGAARVARATHTVALPVFSVRCSRAILGKGEDGSAAPSISIVSRIDHLHLYQESGISIIYLCVVLLVLVLVSGGVLSSGAERWTKSRTRCSTQHAQPDLAPPACMQSGLATRTRPIVRIDIVHGATRRFTLLMLVWMAGVWVMGPGGVCDGTGIHMAMHAAQVEEWNAVMQNQKSPGPRLSAARRKINRDPVLRLGDAGSVRLVRLTRVHAMCSTRGIACAVEPEPESKPAEI
ncbi:hypothetical protein EVG20_g10776 [Dentipellis fragilis]|uniref:Uncharacterized protein n=1 Tax=Dentipellis fragilis TaxID=205917 RepID=A0A4Y9XP97_9AGAM|nr:hypothetical protein EVG20_g10776 [Dentipellis fragilis]